ncbi:MAG: hypothetical protein ACOYIE_06365 [Agathobaculum sp.]|jgi:hypothetical protein
MNTFLEDLFWNEARPFMRDPKDPLEAFLCGMRFAFDLMGALYAKDQQPH